jgi:dienelactone hydrolase
MVTKSFIAAYLLLLCFTSLAQESREPYWLGEKRGPHATGTVEMLWTDEERGEMTTTDPDDKRRVMVQLWYPAAGDANGDLAPYAKDITLYDAGIQDIFKSIANRSTRSISNAPLSSTAASFPLIVYSHGGDGQIFSGTFVTEFLASNGYIVMSVGHTDDSRVERFPDGVAYVADNKRAELSDEAIAGMSQMEIYDRVVRDSEEFLAWRIQDISFALDQLQALNRNEDSLFYGKVDMDRVGAIGWSRGGAAAFQISVDDGRVKAAINLDGTIFGQSIETTGSTRPLLMVENADSVAPPAAGATDADRAELNAAVQSYTWGMFRRSTADWYYATLSGTNHHSFSDYILAYETFPEGIRDPAYIHGIINELAVEFFGKYLMGWTDTPLLKGTASPPELKINRSTFFR